MQQYGLERYSRPDSLICRLEFLAEPKKLPHLRSLDKPTTPSESLYWATAKGKVVDLWLRDKELLARDSVRFALTYEKTDSLLRLQEKTDTLVFIKPQARAKKHDQVCSKQEKSPLQITLTGASGAFAGTPSDSLYVTASRPLAASPPPAIRLEVQEDSLYKPQDFTVVQDSLDQLRYTLRFPRAYGKSYRARIDSAAVRDIYGAACDSVAFTQQIQKEDEFGQLTITLQGIRSSRSRPTHRQERRCPPAVLWT